MAVVMGDCYIEGVEVLQSPRAVLRKQIAEIKKRGYVFKTGVEAEFFILSSQSKDRALAVSDEGDSLGKPCYDAQSMMRRYSLLTDIVLTLNKCGFGVYQTDHEDANGQFEINWHYQDCMTTADQHIFFKWAVKTLAERHGFSATFMPKPFSALSGNGCHIHCSMWAADKNVFEGANGELSEIGRHFLGGVLAKAPAYCVITNPVVNSYKRLNSSPTASGYSWSPNRVSWSGNNRSHMVRIPEGDRFELRLPDGAANPYLLQATMLACGIWGMDTKADPSGSYFPSSVNMYAIPDGAPELKNIQSLPRNLLDAIRELEADKDLAAGLGEEFMQAFLKQQKLAPQQQDGSIPVCLPIHSF
ncbi:glnT [Symbiodinium pilosum]|uniref:GlnT protein n=1 Tax=Symbiodinium pilosum TaxID=2952 RepID=A0A812XFM6_SYMPI|nr:glnT [Symbiodinium pilosum]